MKTHIPICAGTRRWLEERREMGKELAKKLDDDNHKHLHDLLQRVAQQEEAAAQKAAEEIVFGFYRSGNLPSAIVLLDL